jgi:putative DNA primase/helicase
MTKAIAILKHSEPVENAAEFWRRRKPPLVFHQGVFYEWRGTHYHEISVAAVKTDLYDFLSHAKVKTRIVDGDGHEAFVDAPFRPDDRAVGKVLDALKHSKDKAFVPDDIHAPAWLHGADNKPDPTKVIAVQNGILDLETGELISHSKDFFTMTALPFNYDPEAKCEQWQAFVEDLFPDGEHGKGTRREFQKAIGYLLSSDLSQQKIFLVIGPKRSGKGTTMRVLKALLGKENVVSTKLNDLGEGFGKEQLIGKKAAFFPDERLDSKTSGIVEWLLSISGEDDVSIRRKNLRAWTGSPSVRLWIASNTTPGFEDASGVIASRFIVFKLTQSFADNPDTELTEKLLAELPGILNWALDGLRMLREDGAFIQPEEAADTLARMADIASPVLQFAHEYLIVEEDGSDTVDNIRARYVTWCGEGGNKPQARGRFMDTICNEYPGVKVRNIGPRGNQVPTFYGIRLRRDKDREFILPENEDVMAAKVVSISAGRRP